MLSRNYGYVKEELKRIGLDKRFDLWYNRSIRKEKTMTAQEIQDKVFLVKRKNGRRWKAMGLVPRCAICKTIMIVNEEGEYVCVNSDIHDSKKQYIMEEI